MNTGWDIQGAKLQYAITYGGFCSHLDTQFALLCIASKFRFRVSENSFQDWGKSGPALACVTLAAAYNCRAATVSSFIAPSGPKSTHYFQIPAIPKNSPQPSLERQKSLKSPKTSHSTWISTTCIEAGELGGD